MPPCCTVPVSCGRCDVLLDRWRALITLQAAYVRKPMFAHVRTITHHNAGYATQLWLRMRSIHWPLHLYTSVDWTCTD
jgi:hypothetical protein